MQIYALLPRAEAVNAVVLPDALVAQMTRHLISLADRDINHPVGSGEFFTLVAGKEESEAVGFLRFPWAVRAADLWLQRDRKAAAAPEHVRRVQRSLGHMIVDEGGGLVEAYSKDATFRAAELLWNLSGLRWQR